MCRWKARRRGGGKRRAAGPLIPLPPPPRSPVLGGLYPDFVLRILSGPGGGRGRGQVSPKTRQRLPRNPRRPALRWGAGSNAAADETVSSPAPRPLIVHRRRPAGVRPPRLGAARHAVPRGGVGRSEGLSRGKPADRPRALRLRGGAVPRAVPARDGPVVAPRRYAARMICFSRQCRGSSPTTRLKIRLNCESEVKPAAYAASLMFECGFNSRRFTRSTRRRPT